MRGFLTEYKRNSSQNGGKRVSKSTFLQELLREAVTTKKKKVAR
jgi:hypothetical protein